jgi:hypothetical protein
MSTDFVLAIIVIVLFGSCVLCTFICFLRELCKQSRPVLDDEEIARILSDI